MPINHGEFVWFDGRMVRWQDATVHVATHALHYGSSVFEGVRAYQLRDGSTAIFRLTEHMQRMINSCKLARMHMPFTLEQLNEAMLNVVGSNGQPSCYIRPLAFRALEALGLDGRACPTSVVIFSFAWGTYLGPEALENGIDAMISSWRRISPESNSNMAKIGGQYINSSFATMEARELGYQEAIMLDHSGNISEGSGENLFIISNGVLITPPLASSILGGITRDSVMQIADDLGIPVREQMLTRDMLYLADELFMTGTAAEVTPVRSVDRLTVGSGTRGEITRAIQERFFAIVHGEVEDRHGWLTRVPMKAPAQG